MGITIGILYVLCVYQEEMKVLALCILTNERSYTLQVASSNVVLICYGVPISTHRSTTCKIDGDGLVLSSAQINSQ